MTERKTKKSTVDFIKSKLKSIDFKKIQNMQDKKIAFDCITDLKKQVKVLMEEQHGFDAKKL
jgi:CRISPR/Cas system CMR-associated protein Cmr5 small subunit